jgi:hypothetical protein
MATALAVNLTLAVALGALIAHWAIERQRLRSFVRTLRPLPADPRQLALEVAGRLFARPHRHNDVAYLLEAFAPLGATAGSLIEQGGCCSGMSRLYILCLSQLGIRAHQITLYHRTGNAQHCLVEVRLPDGPLIADPIYGFYFTDDAGRPIGLADLQNGATPRFVSLPHSDRTAYPSNDYYAFAFARSRTVNWTKSWYRRQAYYVLTPLTRGGVDRLRVPAIFEWPQVLLGTVLTAMIGAVHLFVWMVGV